MPVGSPVDGVNCGLGLDDLSKSDSLKAYTVIVSGYLAPGVS